MYFNSKVSEYSYFDAWHEICLCPFETSSYSNVRVSTPCFIYFQKGTRPTTCLKHSATLDTCHLSFWQPTNWYHCPIQQIRKLRCRVVKSVTTRNYRSGFWTSSAWLQSPSSFHNNHQRQEAKHSDIWGPLAQLGDPWVPTLPTQTPVGLGGRWKASALLTQGEPLTPGLPPTFLSHPSENVQYGKGSQGRRSRNKILGF